MAKNTMWKVSCKAVTNWSIDRALYSGNYPGRYPSGRYFTEPRDLSWPEPNCKCTTFPAVYYPVNCRYSFNQISGWHFNWHLGCDCPADHLCRSIYWPSGGNLIAGSQ